MIIYLFAVCVIGLFAINLWFLLDGLQNLREEREFEEKKNRMEVPSTGTDNESRT